MDKNRVKAYAGIAVLILVIGLSFPFVKIGLAYSNPYELLAHRFTVSLIGLLPLIALKVIPFPHLKRKEWVQLIVLSLFYPVLMFAFQAVGMQYSSASQAGILFAITPVFTLIGERIFLKAHSSLLQKAGILLSVLGLVYICIHQDNAGESSLWGIILLLLSVLSMTAYYIIGKPLMSRFNSMSLTAVMIVLGFVVFNLLNLVLCIKDGTTANYFSAFANWKFTGAVVYLAVLSTILTAYLTNYTLIYIKASTISIFGNINPIVAIAGGALFLNEQLYSYEITGGLAVVAGVILVLLFPVKKNK